MRRQMEALRRRLGGLPAVFGVVLVVGIVAVVLFMMAATLNMVTVRDSSGASVTLLTASAEPAEIIRLAGFSADENDKLLYEDEGEAGAEVTIVRAFPVQVEADGKLHKEEVTEGTVADLIESAGVRLGPNDYVEPAPETPLSYGIAAQVHRVAFVEETRREELEPAVVEAYMAKLPEDSDFAASTRGDYEVLYRDKLVDGLVVASEMVEITPIHEPLEPRALDSFTIQPGVPCSRIKGFDDIEVGADGIPLNYASVMNSAICTAYSSSGGRGASGLGLYCGTAAVNPNVIPYGTRMYITSADGSFVYGYCIATDTGIAMMDGRVDLDLYFETNAECYQFGKRNMVVYILPPAPEAS